MARRRMIEEPVSRLAASSLRLALFSLIATFVALIIVRSGALDLVPALSTLAGALVLAAVAILLAFGAGIVIWRDGLGGLRQAVLAVLIGLIWAPALISSRRSTILPPIRSTRRNLTPLRGCGRVMPTRSPIRASMRPSSSMRLIQTSIRRTARRRRKKPSTSP
jgi:hypothetical protein